MELGDTLSWLLHELLTGNTRPPTPFHVLAEHIGRALRGRIVLELERHPPRHAKQLIQPRMEGCIGMATPPV